MLTVVVLAAACGSSGSEGGGLAGKGNGVSSQPPAQIVAAAQAALRSVKEFVLSGTLVQGASTMRVKLIYAGPSTVEAQVDFGDGKGGDGILLPSAGFVRVNRALASSSRFGDRWVEVSTSVARREFFAGLGNMAPKALANELGTGLGALRRGGTTKVDGIPAVVIQTTGPGRVSPGTISVATTGPAYPLRITGTCRTRRTCTDGGFTGDVTLRDFNNAPAITAPTHPLSAAGRSTSPSS